jgi:hypothetical protein
MNRWRECGMQGPQGPATPTAFRQALAAFIAGDELWEYEFGD